MPAQNAAPLMFPVWGGGGVYLGQFGYVPLESLYPYSLFCGQLYTPSSSPLGNCVIFAIPTESLSIYVCSLY